MKSNVLRKGPNIAIHNIDGSTELTVISYLGIYKIVIDTTDYELVKKYRWFISTSGKSLYARARWHDGPERFVYLHILLCPQWKLVDHEDGNGLNNRRHNLREANKQQNAWNQKTKEHTSKYHGVSWQSARNKWVAQLMVNGKQNNLGRFDTEEEAYKARLDAEEKYLGGFTRAAT